MVKWLNTEVCKTSIQRFESARRLHFLSTRRAFFGRSSCPGSYHRGINRPRDDRGKAERQTADPPPTVAASTSASARCSMEGLPRRTHPLRMIVSEFHPVTAADDLRSTWQPEMRAWLGDSVVNGPNM